MVLAAALGAAGCSEGDEGPPRGIVVNLGGRIAVLDKIDSQPDIVVERPEGTERLDVYKLTAPRQLETGHIIGISDGSVVAIEPAKPEQQVLLGPATSWFPTADGKKIWAVSEEPADTACAGQQTSASVQSRFTVTEYETSGRPSQRTHTLQCGLRPLAETDQGIVAAQTTTEDDTSRARTNLVLLGSDTTTVRQSLAQDAVLLAVGGHRLIWKQNDCDGAECMKVYDAQEKDTANAPQCAQGETVGRGSLDATGRWYASTIRSDGGYRLAVLDLDEDSCKDLGTNAALAGNQDLDGPLSGTWSKANLLVLDSATGALTSFNAASGKEVRRPKNLDVTDDGQVWGARAD
ncbi:MULTISPECIES: hypothetical protein [Streptomyces]|uniref:Uncharacterized protein n=1 Tax=Streptomyces venezuelae TaxID=54571 RepID=A0A5P2ATF4_STRVZ|nr:hypothetical protein [Streptomyces venezuelae]QES21572.1 hypothetical protein DEJ46_22725 [Streptomyces venezuelae]